MLSENTESRVGTTFGFNLCAAPPQVILIIYFEKELGKL